MDNKYENNSNEGSDYDLLEKIRQKVNLNQEENDKESVSPETVQDNQPAKRPPVYINSQSYGNDTNDTDRTHKKKRGRFGAGALVATIAACVVLSALTAFGAAYMAKNEVEREYEEANKPSIIIQSAEIQGADTINTDSTQGKLGTYAEVAQKASKSVVEIRTETVSTSSIFSQYITQGAGSGVIITADGYIITNNHVIDGASNVTVTTNNGTEYPAKIIGYDSESDIAVIKIEAEGLIPAVVGDSSKLVVGEEVVAIGNPLGSLGGTVTNGIISALARDITVDGTQMTLLQTNAAINPGNSGGGLFNMAGELIGIVNAKSSGSGIEGLGFAIPSRTASQVVEQLINYGYVRGRVSLGITYMDIKDAYTAMSYRVNTLGMYIVGSEHNEELKIGDRVTAIDGNEVTYGSDLKSYLKDCKVGDKVTLTVVREGKYVDVEMECLEYVPGQTTDDVDKTQENKPANNFFDSPFSWFGF